MVIKCKRVDFLGVIQSINLSSSDNETSTSSSTADTFNMLQTPSQPKRSWPTNFVSPGLAAALDRTKVSVPEDGTMKLLGIPQLPNGTGQAEATAVFSLIQE